MNLIEKAKERPGMVGTVAAIVALMGGSLAIEMPADRKVAELETQVAQSWYERQQWEQQQQQYHRAQRLDAIDWRMRDISREINRLNQIPQYLGRPLTEQEAWQIQELKEEWKLLQEERYRLGG